MFAPGFDCASAELLDLWVWPRAQATRRLLFSPSDSAAQAGCGEPKEGRREAVQLPSAARRWVVVSFGGHPILTDTPSQKSVLCGLLGGCFALSDCGPTILKQTLISRALRQAHHSH